MSDKTHQFASNFPATSLQDWRDAAQSGLKGQDFDSALVTRSLDGVTLGPLFTADDIEALEPSVIKRLNSTHLDGRPWHLAPSVDFGDIAQANQDALEDLNGGASALTLALDPSGNNGVAIRSHTDFKRLIEGVLTDLAPLYIAPQSAALDYAQIILAHFKDAPDNAQLSLGLDAKIAPQARASITQAALDMNANWQVNTLNIAPIHDAGVSEAVELAALCGYAADTLRALISQGLSANDAAGSLDVVIAVDAHTHFGAIKLRSARQLLTQVLEAFGVSNARRTIPIRAITSRRMMSRLDPWSNLLRLTSASFAAVIGGADAITTLPFTQPLGPAMSSARRLSRNLQILMMEESHLGHVQDPAAGSYAYEAIGADLMTKAWAKFQAYEALGGLSTEGGHAALRQDITRSSAARRKRIASAEIGLVGVNLYPSTQPRRVELRRPAVLPPVKANDITGHPTASWEILRDSLPFETLSASVKSFNSQRDAALTAHILQFGHSAVARARAQFCSDYLALAGISALVSEFDPKSLGLGYEINTALKAHKPDIIIAAGEDAAYREVSSPLAKLYQTAPTRPMLICARPKLSLPELPKAYRLYQGQDRIALLSEVLGRIGVELPLGGLR